MNEKLTDDAQILPPSFIDELREFGRIRQFPKNAIIVVEGEPAETLYIVNEGRLRVFLADDEGREAELRELNPGDYFGELMLGSRVRTASVKTLLPSKLTLVSRDVFERFISERPDAAWQLIQELVERVKTLTETVQSLALMDVYERVVRLFNDTAESDGGKGRFIEGISQQKIAERVGASRSMINRIFKDLTEGGYISASRNRIDLHRELPKKW